MAITSVNDLLSATKFRAVMTKTANRTAVAATPFSVFDLAGAPGAGVLAGTNATVGVVPIDNNVGYPTFPATVSTANGETVHLSRLAFSSNVACRLGLFDRLYVLGALPFNAAVTVTNPPSFAARLPGGSFRNTELWLETVTAFTGNQTVTITYTNEAGVTGRSTTLNLGVAPTVGRCTQIPLAAGDNGIQRIESVTSTVSTAGTFNVMILRPLNADGVRVRSANDGDTFDFLKTGLIQLHEHSALYMMVTPDSTSTGAPSISAEFAVK